MNPLERQINPFAGGPFDLKDVVIDIKPPQPDYVVIDIGPEPLLHSNPLANQINPNVEPIQPFPLHKKIIGVLGLGAHLATRTIGWVCGGSYNLITGSASLGFKTAGCLTSITPADVVKYAVGISNVEKAAEILWEGKETKFKNGVLMVKNRPDILSKVDGALKELAFGVLKMTSTALFYGGGAARLLTHFEAIDPIKKHENAFDVVRDISEKFNEVVVCAGWKAGEGAVFVFPYIRDAAVTLYTVSEKIISKDPQLFAILGATAGTALPFFYCGAKNLGFQSKVKFIDDAGDYKIFETSGGDPKWPQWFKGWAQLAAGATCFTLGSEALLMHMGFSYILPGHGTTQSLNNFS